MNERGRRRRAAVLGSPIAHSLSPVLHLAAYAELGLNWSYDAVNVDGESIAGFLAAIDEKWVGLSLTMPLKEIVIPMVDEISALAAQTRSVNTVLVMKNGRRRGENTDVEGIRWALMRNGIPGHGLADSTAAVIGAGATARSAVTALGSMGATGVSVTARRAEAIADLGDAAASSGVNVMAVPWQRAAETLVSDVVISTLPAGAADHLAVAVPPSPGALLDVVYSPWPSPLANAWSERGGTVISGLEMLVGQAAAQVRLMTGLEPPAEVMLAAGLDELAARSRPR